ncbi:serine hydrolase [Actinomadura madurae]|uniref:serine hydrolase n=2 Tax=Actinomadura madurae TaxID=1993 RepID=UPI0020D25682|nr:serine hydrolase [Actinomadura madurae]MCP9966221.1 class A beta-lactamase-related serine hydrolase [Actinomadura madurae]MCQ0009766.1 class A beta-lactamase-related serine hydrolase [Actinomadura madurae]
MRRAGVLAAVALAATGILAAGSQAIAYRPAPVPLPTVMTMTPTPKPTTPAFQRDALTRALDAYLDGRPGRLSVSARDLTTGLSYTYGRSLRTATASIVKVDIVIALLLKAQREKRTLTPTEKALAERAITVSDNAAATALWQAIGGADGLASANRKLGLRDTEPGPGTSWGSTTTSAADQVRLLTALTSDESPLHSANRRYVRRLMGDVTPEQAWGVSVAGSDAELKNGWLPRDRHGGRWTVNSIGIVRDGDRTLLLALISERGTTMQDGIETIEHVCETVAASLARVSGDR